MENYLHAYISEDQIIWVKLLSLAQFAYNNSQNHTIKVSLNHLLHSFDCEICVDIADNISERRISTALDYIKKLHQLCQDLCLWLAEAQEQMTIYYNTYRAQAIQS